jgi:hypothetical protein
VTGFKSFENGLDAINISVTVSKRDAVQPSLGGDHASLQVAGVKIYLLVYKLMLLGLELEEFMTAHPEEPPGEPPPLPVEKKIPHVERTSVQQYRAKPYPLLLKQGVWRAP